MTLFWIIAVVLSLVAAAFVVLPGYISNRKLLATDRRQVNVDIFEERGREYAAMLEAGDIEKPEYDQLMIELKRNLLSESSEENSDLNIYQSGKLPIVFAVLVPLFAFLAYTDTGFSLGAINDVALADELKASNPHDKQGMEDNVEKLAERLKNQPDNHEGWFLLAQSYMNMHRYEDSAKAFKHLLDTFTEDYSIAAYYTEALYMADERKVTPRVEAAIDMTLALNPHDLTMLEIKALGAFQAGDPAGAIALFKKALTAGAEGERAEMIQRAIARIQEDMGLEPDAIAAKAETTPPIANPQMLAGNSANESSSMNKPAVAQRSLKVLVEVADGVDIGASTPVFVFARAVNGPPMPLAVQRMVRGALPTLVELDESMAMMKGMGLADFDKVQVVARISSSGIANASPDDYQALSGTIDLTSNDSVIKLKIEKQVKDF